MNWAVRYHVGSVVWYEFKVESLLIEIKIQPNSSMGRLTIYRKTEDKYQ